MSILFFSAFSFSSPSKEKMLSTEALILAECSAAGACVGLACGVCLSCSCTCNSTALLCGAMGSFCGFCLGAEEAVAYREAQKKSWKTTVVQSFLQRFR